MSYDVITPTKYSFSPSIEKFNEACAILGHIGIFQLRKRSCLLVVFPTGASCAFNPSEKKFIRSSGSLKCCLFPTSRSEYPKIWCWRTWKVYVCPTTPPKKKTTFQCWSVHSSIGRSSCDRGDRGACASTWRMVSRTLRRGPQKDVAFCFKHKDVTTNLGQTMEMCCVLKFPAHMPRSIAC